MDALFEARVELRRQRVLRHPTIKETLAADIPTKSAKHSTRGYYFEYCETRAFVESMPEEKGELREHHDLQCIKSMQMVRNEL